ncbi:MAG: ATP-binding protein [Oscillospiraceae bacterium]|nr:ATP-binding protein [Oscillospiraceae bacterium]
MTKRIFRAVCITSVTVLFASIILIMGVLYEYFNEMRKNQIKSELSLAKNAVEAEGISYLEKLEKSDYRLTWIDKSGNILFDSQSNSENMENHLEREEVKKAFETGAGESERYSSTLTEKMIYCAELLDNGTVLRISASQLTVLTLFLGIAQPIAIVFVVALVISFFFASRISKRIVEPLNSIDLNNPLENDAYDEISPFLSRIANQQKQIKLQENELNQRKNEFLAITSNMNEGLVLLGKNKKIISLNPSAESFFTSESDCTGKSFIEIERSSEIIHSLEKAELNDTSEVQINRNGRIFQLNISCIRDTGELSGFVILIFDVTEKIDSENRRREFTANVSHELKSPLQSIMGSAELIETGIVKKEDMPKFIGNIRSEATRLLTLINDIIKLSQLDEGTVLHEQEFDLYSLIQENIDILKDSAEKKNISLSLKGESINIKSIRPLVSEIIYNLIDNAIKYNIENGKVNVTVSEDDKGVYFSVADTGIGIPPEYQERVFERFYRVDKSHSKETGGTGLGLSIVKHAVQDIGADIRLESISGKGTVVTVIL